MVIRSNENCGTAQQNRRSSTFFSFSSFRFNNTRFQFADYLIPSPVEYPALSIGSGTVYGSLFQVGHDLSPIFYSCTARKCCGVLTQGRTTTTTPAPLGVDERRRVGSHAAAASAQLVTGSRSLTEMLRHCQHGQVQWNRGDGRERECVSCSCKATRAK